MTIPEPETSGQDAVSAAASALREVATACVCGGQGDDACTCPPIFEHVISGHRVVEIAGPPDAIAQVVLAAAAPHIRADEFHRQLARLRRAADQFAAGTKSTPGVSWVAGFQAAIEYLSAPDGPGDATAPDALARILAALDDHARYRAWHAEPEHRRHPEAAPSVLAGVREYLADVVGGEATQTPRAAAEGDGAGSPESGAAVVPDGEPAGIPCQVYALAANGERICDRRLRDAPPCCFPATKTERTPE